MIDNLYPGFTLLQFFETPVVPIPGCQSLRVIHKFEQNSVEYCYNSAGYRNPEFDIVQTDYILVLGCSHTEGIGLPLEQTWVSKLQQMIGCSLVNLGKAGAGADFVAQNLQNWLSVALPPRAVIIQWPNPCRAVHWNKGQAHFCHSMATDTLYKEKVIQGEENFFLPWCSSIIQSNWVCKQINVPVLNLCFETPESVAPTLLILNQKGIDLHLDQKQPGLTWHFDSKAFDHAHHSEWCTEQWAKRVLTLVKNVL
jgi:hypothetical protein